MAMRASGTFTRFDDRLGTMLARDLSTPAAATATWTQIADLLAQEGPNLPAAYAARALAALSVLRHRVPIEMRALSVRGLARRCRFAPLAVLLASEPAQVAAPLFDRLHLDDASWLEILPEIGPLARSRLRGREDLSPVVRRALDDFGSTDFALSGALHDAASIQHHCPAPAYQETTVERAGQATQADPDTEASDIAQLVHRIEAWRQRRPEEPSAAVPDTSRPVAFLCDTDGLIRAVDGLPRAAFVGISLARAAEPGEAGVDAGVARAFDKRAPIGKGRVALAPGSPWSGVWAIEAQPLFDARTGRFTGYRGHLAVANEPFPAHLRPAEPSHADTLRQMLHELRSPLNAMSGFAQLIDGQYFGPVPDAYRKLNRAILRDVDRLGTGIDDLALSAELDAGSYRVDEGHSSAAEGLQQFASRHDNIALDTVDSRASLPISSGQLAMLLDRIRRALDPEEIVPVTVTMAPDRAHNGWQIIFTPDYRRIGSAGEATQAAARLLADRLAECHGARLHHGEHSTILNFPGVMAGFEAAV